MTEADCLEEILETKRNLRPESTCRNPDRESTGGH